MAYYRFQCLKLGIRRKKIKLTSDFSFSYIEKGNANSESVPVLLVHGFSASKEQYLGVMKYFPQSQYVISVDLFGHGETSLCDSEQCGVPTQIDYLNKFVDLMGLSKQKFHLVGSSLGGHIAGMYSVTYPENLLSLTMVCPQGISYEAETKMKEEAERTQTTILLPQTEDEYLELIRMTSHKEVNIPNILVSGLLQVRKQRNDFYEKTLRALFEPHSEHLLERNLHAIQTPTMVVWGKEDKLIDVECLDVIKDKIPSTPKVVVLDDVGHSISLERPRKLAFVLMEFINTFV